jgi:hypothetical protein
VFCRGDRVTKGRVHDDDARIRRRPHIDRIDADPGAADDFETRQGRRNDRRRDLGGRPGRDAVILARDLRQFFRASPRRTIDDDTVILEDFGGKLGHLVGDKDFRSGLRHCGTPFCLVGEKQA